MQNRLRIFDGRILDTALLSITEKLLYLKLVDFASTDYICYPKKKTISEALGVSVSSVSKSIRQLKELGFIKTFRKHHTSPNTYVIIPLDWVSNLTSDKIKIVAPTKQNISSVEELENWKNKITEYYKSEGRIVGESYVDTKRREKGESIGTDNRLPKKIMEISERIEKQDFKDWNAQDFTITFAYYYREKYGVLQSINYAMSNAICKDLFVDTKVDTEISVNIIRKYIDIYDDVFKSSKYVSPTIQGLRTDFIYTRVLKALQSEHIQQEPKQSENHNIVPIAF